MEGVAAIFGLLALGVVIGALRGWISFFKLGRVETGLSRVVASFMGLGLALLGLAYLYQRATRLVRPAGPSNAAPGH